MGGVARLAVQMGYQVSGSDANVYPPMSEQLRELDVVVHEGYSGTNLEPRPDLVVIGNALSRGNVEVEAVLNSGLPYTSGPQWVAENVLAGNRTLAVAGTHGKTTTASLLAWILESAGLEPGFLIGGVPENFGVSARRGGGSCFVIEADEYDSAFFDKRSKCIHYRPHTAILNNVEFDHADIFADLDQIQRQLHHFIRTVPGDGLIIHNAEDANVESTLARGCWSRTEAFYATQTSGAGWTARLLSSDGGSFEVIHDGTPCGAVSWPLFGRHNVANALAAIAAAADAGVDTEVSCAAASQFKSVKRRLQTIFERGGVHVYDDFAHHPTAIRSTLEAVRQRVGKQRIIAVMEPRSNTMRMGIHRDSLVEALAPADVVICYQVEGLSWDPAQALGPAAVVLSSVDDIVDYLRQNNVRGDHIVLMSNGGFGGLRERLLAVLSA